MPKIHRPQFIRKYDFIHYFTWSEDQWLWNDDQLSEYITNKTKITSESSEIEDFIFEDQTDPKELIDAMKDEKSEIDFSNPKIFEGILIDQQSRKFIAAQSDFKDCRVFDFDVIFKDNYDLQEQAAYTKELLTKHDNIIIFQPVFIYKGLAIAKPDAFIKKNNEIHLIEVKGTTAPKLVHVVDMLYQHHIINHFLQAEFGKHIEHYALCVVAYDLCSKNEIHFIITPYGTDTKTGSHVKKVQGRNINEWLQLEQSARLGQSRNVLLKDMLTGHPSFQSDPKSSYTVAVRRYTDPQEFDRVIQILSDHQMVDEPSLLPYANYGNKIKNFDYMKQLKIYWKQKPPLFPMNYSNLIIQYPLQYKAFTNNVKNLKHLVQFIEDTGSKNTSVNALYRALQGKDGFTKFQYGALNIEKTRALFQDIRSKKVYFDFESINPAVRVIDNSLPCQQIVTQVSVIMEENNLLSEANNIVLDPQNITINDFKMIVDTIYPKSDASQYSYIVYNQSFEKTQLLKMNEIINDPIYTEKINLIVANLVDLANFFSPRMNCVLFEELYGYFSIKFVLEVIQNHYPDIYKRAKCKDYHQLPDVQNGSDALNITSKRFFGLVNLAEWGKIICNLKVYCENDVRAMIAVYFLIEYLCTNS